MPHECSEARATNLKLRRRQAPPSLPLFSLLAPAPTGTSLSLSPSLSLSWHRHRQAPAHSHHRQLGCHGPARMYCTATGRPPRAPQDPRYQQLHRSNRYAPCHWPRLLCIILRLHAAGNNIRCRLGRADCVHSGIACCYRDCPTLASASLASLQAQTSSCR
jgi:hypothetical protein